MALRHVKGIGSAYYAPHEERLAQKLLDGGHYGEVEVIHTMKVLLGGAVLPDEQDTAVEPEQMRLG